jgi:hypothetical protein
MAAEASLADLKPRTVTAAQAPVIVPGDLGDDLKLPDRNGLKWEIQKAEPPLPF